MVAAGSTLKLPGTEVAAWVPAAVEGSCPLRKGSTFTLVEDKAYVIGGRLSDGTVTNDVHCLSLGEKGRWKWSRVHCDPSAGPSVRECHTATYIGNGKILVFGGQLYLDHLEVYGDVYIFDTARGQWEVPEIDGKGPSPRSRHTATYSAENDTLYVFGGYRKTTRRLNDVHELNLDTMTWSSPSVDGDPPAPRYGHSACLLGNNLFVMGGIDGANNALSDVAFLDVRVRHWVEVPEAAKLPRAVGMFSAVAVPSAGTSKVFTFGGQTGSIMDFNGRVSYLDTKYMEWKDAKISGGAEPPAVGDCSCVYDARSKSVIIFGGAGQQYLDSLFVLDVSSIVGPDYAMFSLSPPMGPLHGGMVCRISGSGFRESHEVRVLLTDGKREAVVKGERTSEEEVAFSTPDLSVFGERTSEVLVRLSLEKDGAYTVNHVPFSLYLDTEARNCIAYGPGVMPDASTRLETSIIIWAKNMAGADRTHGGEAFVVSVVEKKTPEQLAEEEAARQRAADEKRSNTAKVGASGAGGAAGGGRPTSGRTSRAGPGGKRRIGSSRQGGRDSPNSRSASRGPVAEDEDTTGPANFGDDDDTASVRGGATPTVGDSSVAGDGGTPAVEVPVEVTDLNNGTYECRYTVAAAGRYEVQIEYNGIPIRGSPFMVNFRDDLVETQPRPVGSEINFVPVMKVEVPRRLAQLEELTQHEQSTLALQVKDGNVHTLIKVMSCIDSHTVNAERVDLEIESLREAIAYLKLHHDPHADSHRKRLRALEQTHAEVKAAAATVDRDLAGHKAQARVGIKQRIEEFNRATEAFEDDLLDHAVYEAETPLLDAYHDLDHTHATLASHTQTSEELVHLSNLFGFHGQVDPSLERLRAVRETLAALKQLWDTRDLVDWQIGEWRKVRWPDLDPEAMESRIKEIGKELRSIDRRAREGDAYEALAARVRNFQQSCPLVVNLRHPSMRERHWDRLMDATGVRVDIHSDRFDLGDLLALDLPRYEDEVDAIVDRALKEEKMEKSLAKLESIWADVHFARSSHQDTSVSLIKITEEDVEQLENDQLVVQSMMGSKYMMTFEKQVLGWKRGLNAVEKVTTIWGEIQRTWAYLVALFIGSEEVKRDLPDDAVRFAEVDREVTAFLGDGVSSGDANVYRICTREGLYDQFVSLQSRLELCEKSLFEYLDSKRMAFPRFYFVSTTDLLDILCNGNQPAKIMLHMPKVFQAIRDLALDEAASPPSATALVSAVGSETVPLAEPLLLDGKVESYLARVIDAMQRALKGELRRAIDAYQRQQREEWLRDYPSQVVMVTTQAAWTSEVARALDAAASGDATALTKYRDVQKTQLDNLIEMVTGDLDRALRQKVMVLITLDTHARDVTDTLIREEVASTSHFRWQSQLRYSWDSDEDDMVIRITDAHFRYGYEYLGNGARLVITPLTDRIYITATQSLHLRLGCAPAGPAGTGKTETTKDLASQLGKPCYVFNCSDQMDYKGMGNIFKGLAASGSWGCFDEFNRLIPEVLSVCSQQFKAVLDAIKAEDETFTVEGATLKLDPTCGVFITMNPGYLGRTELPETLKTLFRPITVVVPDLELICENMLMAEGFKHAKVLARKFTTLYALLRDLLSKQNHYDWGLRAIKAVLVVAGSFKRAEPEIAEADLLMRALRDSNLAKIPDDDVPVFMGLIGDLFPGVEIPRRRDESLERAINTVCGTPSKWPDMGGRCPVPEEKFVLKVVQLDELLAIRHSVFIIGTSGTGKSTVWRTLAKAWTDMGRPTTIRDINPKSISSDELYGYVELASREWKDGLLSNVMREIANVPDEDPKWIVLDGDLDANWIESMNSVMDDNRILTLASNERIPLRPHCRMLFEIRDLLYATPATVSRAGIIYMSEGEQWSSFVRSWVDARAEPEDARKVLLELFDRYVPETLRHVERTYQHIVPVLPFNMVQSLCYILEGLLDPEELGLEPGESLPAASLETQFVFAAVWAFGSALSVKDNVDHRQAFSDWWKETHKSVRFPPRGSVFDVFVDPDSGKFVQWRSVVEEIQFDSRTMLMRNVTVPIAETTSVEFFVEQLLRRKRPLMLVGNAGCGKTALVRGLMQHLPEDMLAVTISLNYYSDSAGLQRSMEDPLEKKAGRNYGPPGSKSLIYFIDDLNMPMLDPYNTQTPIALLRQHLDYGHWFDRERLSYRDLKRIDDTQYICAMNPASGSFTVNPRLQRHFVTFALDLPSPGSLMDIYRTFLVGHLEPFAEEVQQLVTKVVHATLLLHTRVTETFRKTAVNSHYEFNMRHIANVFQGLLMARPAQFGADGGDSKFVQLWLHECERVYCDRLVSAEDIKTYKRLAKEANSKHFANFNLGHLLDDKNRSVNIFCPFAHGAHDKVYDRAATMDDLRVILEEALGEYNEENARMNLLLFEDAIRHVCRITRIIEAPAGHALLVGVGGSGKQSLTRLAAHVARFSVFQISISGTYSMNDLKEDLRQLFIRSGQRDEGLVFLLTEAQVTDERFLVYINDLLSSGDIPELFGPDDRDQIVNAVRLQAKAAGIEDTRDNCWAFFLDRVRANLHVALCFSPLSARFRQRLRRFPALVTCTVIDWFHPWPRDALLGVAKRFLSDVDLGSDAVREGVELFMPFSYEIANRVAVDYLAVERRSYHTTPKSYLELISLFKSMLAGRRTHLTDKISRLQSGIGKLEVTSEEVAVLQERLREQSVVVEEKKLAAEVFAEQVGREKTIVEHESAKANAEAAECEEIQETVSVTRERCERELAAAEPAVARAEAALDTLNKKELTELKSMTRPPAGVDDVMAAVLVLTSPAKGGVPKMDKRQWANSLVLMSKVDTFITMLKNFKNEIDLQRIPAKNFKEVRYYLGLKHFNKEAILVKSKAAAGLVEWVINIVEYYDIFCKVEPMRQALAETERQLEEANTRLADSRARVAELQTQLDGLLLQYDAAEAEKQKMIDEVNASQAKLDLAQRLVTALESENVRWRAGVGSLNEGLDVVIGDVLLSSAFVSYIGGFSKRFRDELLQKHWVPFLRRHGVPMSEDTDPLKILTDDSTIAQWQNQGLPADRVSVENATIVSNAERWPLIIDPQLQGIAWLKEKEGGNGLVVLRLGQKDLAHRLEDAIQTGKPVLIENIGESIDAMLGPVVARQMIRKLGVNYMKIGDKEVEHDPKFRLYLHTKLSNPSYPPEIQAETTLVNFAVTEAGLEDQMLAIVVRSERPELEEQKSQLIKQQNEFKIKLKELEDDLLQRLATAEGDLTEDVALIENLEESKRVATEIQEKVAVARVTEVQINEAREAYRPVASRGAILFFLLRDLRKINVFYEYSLASFVTVFHRGIDATVDPTRRGRPTTGARSSANGGGETAAAVAGDDNGDGGDDKARATAQSTEPPQDADAENDTAAAEGKETSEGGGENGTADGAEDAGSSSSSKDDGAAADGDAAGGGDAGPAKSPSPVPSEPEFDDEDEDLTDEERAERIKQRITNLLDTVTYTVFNYTRRGLFERHKLIFAVQLSLSIAEHAGELDADELDYILHGREIRGTKPERERLQRFLNDDTWARVAALCQLPSFAKFAAEINKHADGWDKWCSEEKPESEPMPKDIKSPERPHFQRLLIVRALRPDRITAAMTDYVCEYLGERYVEQPPFHLPTVLDESTVANPVMFILFPGAQPVKDVEALARDRGMASRLFTVSMGQGQEPIAEAKLDELSDAAGSGGWVFLDNMHLMQSWLPRLERKLEVIAEQGHPDFRCFFSAEPSGDPLQSSVPESILQASIKIVNEPPSDLRANLRRAYAQFTPQDVDERATQPEKYKPALYALCFFHALVLGRRKFGSAGWSRHYSFNMGDLTICAGVLQNYLASSTAQGGAVPFDDLRYVFGEIMYGGHITDHWDRRTNNTYLEVIMRPELYEGLELAPGFTSPAPGDYGFYRDHIETALPKETPQMFGLHPNAEITLLTGEGLSLFRTLLDMKGAVGEGGVGGKDAAVLRKLEELRTALPGNFDLSAIMERVEERTPTIVIVLQETARMNTLLSRIRVSLDELALGLKGALNISEAMEALATSLFMDTVPDSWASVAYPSLKGLAAWFIDLSQRVDQLRAWSDTLETPKSVWISGLFNPQALLTAVVQTTARETNQPLDAMGIETTVTKFTSEAEVIRGPPEGAYVHGFFIDGCRWDVDNGVLCPARLKELTPSFPVIHVKAVPIEEIPSGDAVYECPVYTTAMRGPTYVFTAQLNTEEDPKKWVLAGVALLLSV